METCKHCGMALPPTEDGWLKGYHVCEGTVREQYGAHDLNYPATFAAPHTVICDLIYYHPVSF